MDTMRIAYLVVRYKHGVTKKETTILTTESLEGELHSCSRVCAREDHTQRDRKCIDFYSKEGSGCVFSSLAEA